MRRIWVVVLAMAAWATGCAAGDDDRARMLSGTGGLAGAAAGSTGAGVPGGGTDGGAAGAAGGAAGAAGGAAGAAGGAAGAAGAAGTGVMTSARGCSDLFDPATLVEYAFDISADEWAKIDYEFRNRDALKAAGMDYKTYHPIVFHAGGETVTDAMVRLKGDSSWRFALMDGDKAKMQFVVSFEEVNPSGKFHGLSKIVLDMPDNDETFMQERLGFATMAEIFGLPAPCANSARLSINGQYYGLYVNEEHVGGGFIKRVFPEAPTGDLFAGGQDPKTNQLAPDWDRLDAFWDARDAAAMAAVVDMDASLLEWAAEAMLNDGDGYWGGGHNFYLYDYPGRGYRWLIDDADATFAWLDRSDYNAIYWWAGRGSKQEAGQHYLIVMTDPTWRARYVDALRQQLARWDVPRLQAWIDAWSAQIAGAVADDPHRLESLAEHAEAIAEMRQEVVDRAAYMTTFLACEDGSGDAHDADGDGYAWCNDCDDASAAVNPGAVEICGNGIDDNCNRYADADDPAAGCPAAPPPPTPPPPAM